jgi:hypothetical protein
MSDRPAHRPIGTGAITVRVKRRTDKTTNGDINGGAWIFIGRALWQQIGMPERVAIANDVPGYYTIRPVKDGGYKVTNIDQDGMPRLSVGKTTIDALRLPEGTYAASASSTEIKFTI